MADSSSSTAAKRDVTLSTHSNSANSKLFDQNATAAIPKDSVREAGEALNDTTSASSLSSGLSDLGVADLMNSSRQALTAGDVNNSKELDSGLESRSGSVSSRRQVGAFVVRAEDANQINQQDIKRPGADRAVQKQTVSQELREQMMQLFMSNLALDLWSTVQEYNLELTQEKPLKDGSKTKAI